jgi:hypothetical protein
LYNGSENYLKGEFMEIVKKYNLPDLAAKAGIFSCCLAILALTIGSPLYLGAKIDNFRSEIHGEMNDFRNDMYKEMKDFHGRLERQDAEFKAGILNLNERVREAK